MQFYEYRGYTIYPAPHLVIGSGCWSIELIINHDISTHTYSNDTRYSTKGEAVFHSIQYGKELIDSGIVLFKEAV
jgi:hypothetical protein